MSSGGIYYQTHSNLNLVFQACISFLRCFRKGNLWGNAGNFLSRFTGIDLIFEVFETKVAHFCFCLVRIILPLLICILLSSSQFQAETGFLVSLSLDT